MQDSLIDDAGYPRIDIDVYQVRHARHKIICLQNDLKSIMKKIEKGLEAIHAEDRNTPMKFSNVQNAMEVDDVINDLPQISFAKINLVSSGSPADAAVRFEMEMCMNKNDLNLFYF